MKKIKLNGLIGLGKFALVDDEDFVKLNIYSWCLSSQGYVVCVKYLGRINGKTKNKCIRIHRLIVDAPDNKEVDHINGNRLDNRKCNLRLSTHTENAYNRSVMPNNKIGLKGVSKHSSTWNLKRPWRATIVVNHHRKHLGFFSKQQKPIVQPLKNFMEYLHEYENCYL